MTAANDWGQRGNDDAGVVVEGGHERERTAGRAQVPNKRVTL